MTVAVGRIGRHGSLLAVANIYEPDFDFRERDAVDYYEGESR